MREVINADKILVRKREKKRPIGKSGVDGRTVVE